MVESQDSEAPSPATPRLRVASEALVGSCDRLASAAMALHLAAMALHEASSQLAIVDARTRGRGERGR